MSRLMHRSATPLVYIVSVICIFRMLIGSVRIRDKGLKVEDMKIRVDVIALKGDITKEWRGLSKNSNCMNLTSMSIDPRHPNMSESRVQNVW